MDGDGAKEKYKDGHIGPVLTAAREGNCKPMLDGLGRRRGESGMFSYPLPEGRSLHKRLEGSLSSSRSLKRQPRTNKQYLH